MIGEKVKDSAAKFGCTRQSIAARRKKVAAFIAEKFDIDKYRKPLYALYPLVLNSLIHNLKKNDVTMTIATLKGLQMLVDKQVNDNTNAVNLSNDELTERILGRIGVKPNGTLGDSERSD